MYNFLYNGEVKKTFPRGPFLSCLLLAQGGKNREKLVLQ